MTVVASPTHVATVSGAGVSLRSRIVSAGAWSLGSYAGSQIIRLGSSLVMTRLLMPEAYGLYTLVTTYTAGMIMFSDLGLGAYLLQSEKSHDQAFADGIWSLSALRGVAVWLAGLALAWPMARFYHEPRLLPLLATASLGLAFAAIQSTKLVTANRDLKQKWLAIFNIVHLAVGLVILIALGWWFRSVWALVIGGLVNEVIRAVGSQLVFPGPRNHWRWDPHIAKELRNFSTWIYLSSMLTFLGSQADRLILGKVMPLEFLGLYGVSMSFALLPLALIQQGSVLLSPVIVQLRHRNDPSIQEKLQQFRRLLLKVGSIMVALMCVSSPAFYGFLYDARYHQAGIIAALLGLSIWTSVLAASVDGILMAFGDAKSQAGVAASRVLGAAGGILLGYWIGGPYGLILGAAATGLATYLAVCAALRRWRIAIGWSDGVFALDCLAYAATGWSAVAALHYGPVRCPLPVASALAATALGIVIALRERRAIGRLVGLASERFGRC